MHAATLSTRCLLFPWQGTRPAVDLPARQSTVVLAGEATGHARRLTAGAILEAPNGAPYLDLPYTTRVAHEEHNPISLDSGLWLVARQREYSPEAISPQPS